MAKVLKLGRGDRARAVLHQNRHSDVVPLKSVHHRIGDHAKPEHLIGLPRPALQGAGLGIERQQPQRHQRIDGGFHLPGKTCHIPRQEQLALEEGIHQPAQPHHRGTRHPPRILETAGHPRRTDKQVEHIVAEIALQHPLLALERKHIAERMAGAGKDAHVLTVGHDLHRREGGDGDAIRIRRGVQQILEYFELSEQVALAHRVLGRGQQRHRQQTDRIHVGGTIDVDLNAFGRCIDSGIDPVRTHPGGTLFAPVRRVFGEQIIQPYRLGKTDRHAPVIAPQDAAGSAQQGPHRLLLLGPAGKLVQITLAFHQFFVADVDRLEHHGLARLTQVGAKRHRQRAALGLQQAARARAPTLDEVLDRIATADQLGHVFGKHRRIQRVATETAARKERPALAQHRPDHRQIEIHPGEDVRRHHAMGVKQVGQQQVIDVAAMRRHVNHLVPRCHLLERIEMVHRHAAIDLVPERRQHERQRADHRMRIIGGDLARVAVRTPPCGGMADVVAPRLIGNGLTHRFGREHAIHERAPMRKIRPDHRGADAAEMRTQHPRHFAYCGFRLQPFLQHAAQRHRRRKLHDGVAPVEQHRKKTPETADHRPVFGEQHAKPTRLPIRRTTDENRHRHDLHVQRRISFQCRNEIGQTFRMRAGAWPAEPETLAPRQRHHGTSLPGHVARHRHQRRRQAGLAAGLLEDQDIGKTVAFDRIADRQTRQHQIGTWRRRFTPDGQPRGNDPTQQAEQPGRLGAAVVNGFG